MTVRTRFAPSPTGYLHIGGARTAFFCWLYARHTGGQFVLRIEDTDTQRSTDESVQAILDGMAWLGLDADKGPIYQTQRFDRYREVTDTLLEKGLAYHCYCSKEALDRKREEQMLQGLKPRYNGKCRDNADAKIDGVSPVVRFRNAASGSVSWNDQVRGRISISNEELDDLIIARADGTPTYNFTVVVDDMDMEITHVIRGDDHINNTPRQINIYAALDARVPTFAHVPMILGADGQRLSKRHGAVSVMAYKEQGILPQAMRNYLLRLGWSHGDQEIFSDEEMIRHFDIENANRAAASFDPVKLNWFNQHYIKETSAAALGSMLEAELQSRNIDTSNGPKPEDVAQALQERAETLVEMADKAETFYADFEDFDEAAAKKNLRPVVAKPLRELQARLYTLDVWEATGIHKVIEETADLFELKMGKLGQPLRVAVTGVSASPAIDVTVELVGKTRTLERIEKALVFIGQRAQNG